jgi:hypothetical protein
MVNLPPMLRCIVFLAVLAGAAIFATARPGPLAPSEVCLFFVLLVWPFANLAYRVSMTACSRIIIDHERLT